MDINERIARIVKRAKKRPLDLKERRKGGSMVLLPDTQEMATIQRRDRLTIFAEAEVIDGDCLASEPYIGFACTRPQHHTGPHIACGYNSSIYAIWEKDY